MVASLKRALRGSVLAALLPVLRETGTALVAFSPLGRGFLTGVVRRGEDEDPLGDAVVDARVEPLALLRGGDGGITPRPRLADGAPVLGHEHRVRVPGRRLLSEDISAPLTERSAIEARLALVAWLHEDAIRRERVRTASGVVESPTYALGATPVLPAPGSEAFEAGD